MMLCGSYEHRVSVVREVAAAPTFATAAHVVASAVAHVACHGHGAGGLPAALRSLRWCSCSCPSPEGGTNNHQHRVAMTTSGSAPTSARARVCSKTLNPQTRRELQLQLRNH